MKLRRLFTNLLALGDLITVMVVDVDRELVRAAKELVRLRREHCDRPCDACDSLIFAARERCREWRRLQHMKRDARLSLGAMVFAMSRSLNRG